MSDSRVCWCADELALEAPAWLGDVAEDASAIPGAGAVHDDGDDVELEEETAADKGKDEEPGCGEAGAVAEADAADIGAGAIG